jgi:diguanylate cyclase (GGDEF)-like protein
MGWIASAFALGSISTILVLEPQQILGGVLPDVLMLLSLVLLQVAVDSVHGRKLVVPRVGANLVILEVVVGICLSHGLLAAPLRPEIMGLVLAIQAGATLITALHVERKVNRAPVALLAFDLLCLMIFHIGHSLQLAFHPALERYLRGSAEEASSAAYLFALLGFSLGFFWLTTELQSVKLEDMAGTDPLTRAANRRNFLLWCQQERERSLRTGAAFSIVLVDIDHFKSINDTFGHAVGDTVICDVVDKMRDAIRGLDILGRWGGEEFIILLRDSGIAAARVVAERIRASVQHMDPSAPTLRYGSQRKITVSLGIASRDGLEDIQDLIARADSALYEAKTSGRNRVQESVVQGERDLQPEAPVETPETPAFAIPQRFRRLDRSTLEASIAAEREPASSAASKGSRPGY